MSAGSCTSPGGYAEKDESGRQFVIDDDRTPAQVEAMLRRRGTTRCGRIGIRRFMPNPVDFSLYLITDRHQVPAGRTLLATVEAALQGGVRAVQLREKDLPAADLLPLAEELRALSRRFAARLLLNDRIDVALAVAADGVHLGDHSLPAAVARHLLGPQRLIGVSTHHPAEIAAAAAGGADFVTFGPVFATPSKPAMRSHGKRWRFPSWRTPFAAMSKTRRKAGFRCIWAAWATGCLSNVRER